MRKVYRNASQQYYPTDLSRWFIIVSGVTRYSQGPYLNFSAHGDAQL